MFHCYAEPSSHIPAAKRLERGSSWWRKTGTVGVGPGLSDGSEGSSAVQIVSSSSYPATDAR